MSETPGTIEPKAIRGGAPCAKEVLCWPAAVARARNEARLEVTKAVNERDLVEGMLQGLRNLSDQIRIGAITLTTLQEKCYTATVDNMAYVKEFKKHYETLHQAMKSTSVNTEKSERFDEAMRREYNGVKIS